MSDTVLIGADGKQIKLLDFNKFEDGARIIYTHSEYPDEPGEEETFRHHYALVTGWEPDAEDSVWEYLDLNAGDEREIELLGRKYLLRHEAEV